MTTKAGQKKLPFYGKDIRRYRNENSDFQRFSEKNGETAFMIEELKKAMGGEFKEVNAYRADIRPCIDCRWCFEHEGCAIKDEMQEVYDYIQECDHIVIASPVYFEEITGTLLAMFSRLQTYFSARYIRKEEPVPKKKTGAILLAAGSIGPREKAESTSEMLLRQLSCQSLGTVYAAKTDKVSVRDREDIRRELAALGQELAKN